MKNYPVYLIIFSIIISFYVNADNTLSRDPFNQLYPISCAAQADILQEQIQSWQLKGMIKRQNSNYYQIWLYSNQQWLTITNNEVPHVLLPWQIKAFLSDKVIWQANQALPCKDSLAWTMSFNP